MGEKTLAHKMVCFDGAVNVVAVDTNGDTHQHVLRTLSDASVKAEEVGSFERFETKATGRLLVSISADSFSTGTYKL